MGGAMPAGPMSRAGGTAAHADGPRVVAERRGRPQMTGAASADERGARDAPRLAGARVDGGSVARRAPHGKPGCGGG
jgi:hypothetical protein